MDLRSGFRDRYSSANSNSVCGGVGGVVSSVVLSAASSAPGAPAALFCGDRLCFRRRENRMLWLWARGGSAAGMVEVAAVVAVGAVEAEVVNLI